MSKLKIAIVGYGYVGKAMYKFFEKHYDMVVYDPGIFDPAKANLPCELATKEDVNACDLAVICVPTPTGEAGACDLSIVEESISWVKTPLILIKSTVEVGTTEKLKKKTGKRIVFSPEYCGESAYWSPYAFHTDVKETPWFTFGGDSQDTEAMVNYFMKVVGPTKIYHQTDATTAELAKYVENTFYAMKVTFCYEIAEICKRVGVDYNKMREAWLLDPRLNRMHTAVFQDSIKPFGGKCVLPQSEVSIIGGAPFSGRTSISSLYETQEYLRKHGFPFTPYIESTDAGMKSIESKNVLEVTKRHINEDIYSFETDAGIFECTAEHLMPVEREGKILVIPASEIKETDLLFCNKTESTLQEKVNDNRVSTDQERNVQLVTDQVQMR
jgi:UDPglucose 6-dehydrogenase